MFELDKAALRGMGVKVQREINSNHLSGAKPINCILTVRGEESGKLSSLVRVLWATKK